MEVKCWLEQHVCILCNRYWHSMLSAGLLLAFCFRLSSERFGKNPKMLCQEMQNFDSYCNCSRAVYQLLSGVRRLCNESSHISHFRVTFVGSKRKCFLLLSMPFQITQLSTYRKYYRRFDDYVSCIQLHDRSDVHTIHLLQSFYHYGTVPIAGFYAACLQKRFCCNFRTA